VVQPSITRPPSRRFSTDALAARIARATGARQVALGERLQSLWGGYGELWRAELTLPGATTSSVVKVVQPPAGDSGASQRRKLRSYEVERHFYETYAARCLEPAGCRIPRPMALEHADGGWLFVLEDLDAAGYAERRGRARPAEISATLRWLASFHARFVGAAPDGLWKAGTYWQLATRTEELSQMRHPPLRQAAARIDARLAAARVKTLVHGDAKLENACFAAAGDEVALVDFQYVGGGVGVKDVAYFLNGVLAPRECESLVPVYLDEYFRELRGALALLQPGRDAAELEREWRELFSFAWADFYRFLLGWAPGQFDGDPYSERVTRQVLGSLTSG
jgi:hypothetical protein